MCYFINLCAHVCMRVGVVKSANFQQKKIEIKICFVHSCIKQKSLAVKETLCKCVSVYVVIYRIFTVKINATIKLLCIKRTENCSSSKLSHKINKFLKRRAKKRLYEQMYEYKTRTVTEQWHFETNTRRKNKNELDRSASELNGGKIIHKMRK